MSPVEILQDYIREKEKELKDLKIGLAALQTALNYHKQDDEMPEDSTPEVPSAPTPAPLPAVATEKTVAPAPTTETTVSRVPKEVYTGPRCSACQGKMYPTYRTMPSGAMVNLLKCNDSACGNEVYQ